jgi:hypothetical protein
MKKLISITCFVFAALFANAQLKVFSSGKVSIGSTTTPNQTLDVTGDVSLVGTTKGYRIDNNYMLWNNGKSGCIYVGTAGSSGSTGTNNTFVGYKSGNANTAGASNVFMGFEACSLNTTAALNVAIGYQALAKQAYSNGGSLWNSYNVAIGYQSLYNNNASISTSQGRLNTALGYTSGYSNTTGQGNLFIGVSSGYSNSIADYNTCLGYQTGYYNTSGTANVHIGFDAGLYNPSGSYNTTCGYMAGFGSSGNYYSNNSFFGYQAGYNNSTGKYNTAVGYQAGYGNFTGDSCTFVGMQAQPNGSGYTNCAAFGFGASATASGRMVFGNSKIIGLYTSASGLFIVSDGRFKTNVKDEVKGLDFIKKLRPVTYQVDTKSLDGFIKQNIPLAKDSSGNPIQTPSGDFSASSSIIHSGFIAQEVEQAEKDCGYKSTIVSAPVNNSDSYALNYSEFVVPLVKAVQELSDKFDSLVAATKGQRINNNEKETILQVELANKDNVILYQNQPNPFDGSTVIRFFIPENTTGTAYVAFYDMYGKEVNKVEIKEKGFGKIEANTENLASGIYSYSIIINEKVIDTKKMIKNK